MYTSVSHRSPLRVDVQRDAEAVGVELAHLTHLALLAEQLARSGAWVLEYLRRVERKLANPWGQQRVRRRRGGGRRARGHHVVVGCLGDGREERRRRGGRAIRAVEALVVHAAEACRVHARLARHLVDRRHRVLGELGRARVDEGALVPVLQRLARIIDEAELRLRGLVLPDHVPVLPEGEAEHLALRVRGPPGPWRRVELQLLVQRLLEELRRLVDAIARHRVLDLDVNARRPHLNRPLRPLSRPARVRGPEAVALAVEAVVVRVPAENLVPLALHRGGRRADEGLGRQRRLERRVVARLHDSDVDAALVLDRALQHVVQVGVAVPREAAHRALRVAHALGRAG
mmetsp:Transcript_2061/g.3290  ORF Transcript_2061/g.3290 Transcript_2061/m.3290 type:complete len:345 (+) Transcript_2061:293-1327(+)